MFYDLNIPVTGATGTVQASQEQLETRKRVELLVHLGYQAVAYNHELTGKINQNQVNPIKKLDLPGLSLKQYSRLTLVVDDVSQNYGFNTNNPVVSSYDILAVQPTNEKTFQAACGTFEVDIISLDLSARLPFNLKLPTVGLAVERGIYFELCYGAAIRDATARRNLISNAASLIRATRGKNIILTSQAMRAMELRGPYDIVNFGTLLGLNQAVAKDCISSHCRSVAIHAETRRNTIRAVVSVEPVASLAENEQWKMGNKKRKKDSKAGSEEAQKKLKATETNPTST
ncbi:ribonuclease P/MRP protein subunit RPP1 [Entomortierella parvispora]|uniref:Ribonuclease P/MRP protein subunit RPP1 n=1 Tax=Entomortierella parvispora TaxID=205924 RepID=A0A9P3HDT2_9FUNG|nr:ribonuclease P/MRP protein subunit RPP1 [Entomortierella parvispora]